MLQEIIELQNSAVEKLVALTRQNAKKRMYIHSEHLPEAEKNI